MPDYNKIRLVCEEQRRISATLVDEFLMYYAAAKARLDKEMDRKFSHYRHIIKHLPEGWFNMLKSQFIVHRLFKFNGLIKSYLEHEELKKLTEKEQAYLIHQSENPWRFSFSEIVGNPAPDFYRMIDVFSLQPYLLYSPGITRTKETSNPLLWFNLIGFNGECYHTYGPIAYFNSFEPDDIYFFGTELSASIRDESDIIKNIEGNPVPYMMLVSGSNLPLTIHQNHFIIHCQSETEINQEDLNFPKELFTREYDKGIFRFNLKGWEEFPHFACAYYNEKSGNLILSAMTDEGFETLLYEMERNMPVLDDLGDEPDVRVNMTMISTAEDILKRKIPLHPYGDLFKNRSTPEEKEMFNKMNAFMALILPDINAGRTPDIAIMAKKADLDESSARDIYTEVMKTFGRMGG